MNSALFNAEALVGMSPQKIVDAASMRYGAGLVMCSHFGAESAAFLHFVTQECGLEEIPVIYIYDPETAEFAEQLEGELRLNLHTFHTQPGKTKLEAMQAAFQDPQINALAILFGICRYETDHRKSKKIVEHGEDGFCRIHPILEWTPEQVSEYFREHDLLYHPILSREVPKQECGCMCVPEVRG